MRRSMRGERGHGRLTWRAGVIRRLYWEAGYDALDWWPRGEHVTLPSPHVSGVTDDDQIFTCGPLYPWPRVHITGHKDIDPGGPGRDWFPVCVRGASQLCVCCCVSAAGLSTCCYCPTLRPQQGQRSLPHLLCSWWLEPSLDDIIEHITP